MLIGMLIAEGAGTPARGGIAHIGVISGLAFRLCLRARTR